MNLAKIVEELTPVAEESQGSRPGDDGSPIVSSLIHHPRMKTIIGEYVQQFPEIVAKLLELSDRQDLPALRHLVHQLRGTAGGYGFDTMSELAGKVEDSIVASAPPILIATGTHSLIDVIRRTDGYGQSITTAPAMKKAA